MTSAHERTARASLFWSASSASASVPPEAATPVGTPAATPVVTPAATPRVTAAAPAAAAAPPPEERPKLDRASVEALLASALVYGSEHLRFRGEWALCGLYGLGLGALTHALGGELLPAAVAATLFAVVRHAMRTGLDVRRVHKQ